MTVGIVGLGLIGGSLAKAYREAGHVVYGYDTDSKISDFAVLDGTLSEILSDDNVKECALVLLCIYPEAAVSYLKAASAHISKDTVVVDCCGTKKYVCGECFPLARKYGYTFVGGHPMAGTQYSGYKFSSAGLFKGSCMILVPPVFDDMAFVDRVKDLLLPAGFGRFSITTAEKHDEIIAFTSQLAHVVSNAYVKSPTAKEHRGFSAGSYKDLTRVAWLNEDMWTELCMANRENLVKELDSMINALGMYRDALDRQDSERLRELFAEGKKIKTEIDGTKMTGS